MIETSRLRITGVTGGPLRITGASLVNGAYELATAGGADYELQTERQTIMDNILFIPGIANPVSEINSLLFGQGQQGTFIAPSLTASLISGSTFGTGVETLPDLSPRNNPFSQATPSSRGAWFREPKTGRRNLLERTGEFDNSYWTKFGVNTSGSPPWVNVTAAPDGTMTAEKITEDTATSGKAIFRNLFSSITGTHTWSIFIKSAGDNRLLRLQTGTSDDSYFNPDTGNWLTVGAGRAPFVQSLPGGWFRVGLTWNASGTTFAAYGIAAADNTASYTGNGTSGIFIWGAQLELGSTPTPYQRVTTAFDVTEAGQRDCFGVRADGIDDFYERAIDFSGTDKVTVFAAVRRFTNSNIGIIAQLSADSEANNGAFALWSPETGGSNGATFQNRGTTNRYAFQGTGVANNAAVILRGIGDTGAPLTRLSINGVDASTSTGSLGVVNYGNYPLFIFSRGGSSVFLNGDLYALIVAGGSYPLSTIQRVERLLSRITPTVNL